MKPLDVGRASSHAMILQRYLDLADEAPDALALAFLRPPFVGVELTWGSLVARSRELARALATLGVRTGARCALVLRDHPDTLPVLLALWQLEASAVLIDGSWGAPRQQHVAAHGGASFWLDPQANPAAWRCSRPPSQSEGGDGLEPLPADTAFLGYTSGSTGDPKGVPFTHTKLALTLQAAAAAVTQHRGAPSRRIACSMRLSGSGVLNLHYTWAALAGAAVVVLPELDMKTAAQYWQLIEAHDIDQTFLVPQLIELVNQLARPRSSQGARPVCLTGSAPLPVRTQQRFQARFGLPLLNAYGLSESMCAAFFGKLGADGMATNDIGMPRLLQARVAGVDGTILEGEAVGELQLAGPTMFDGYYRNPAATALALDGRWFRTGDVVRRDGGGAYSIVGRSKEVVMKGGYSIYLNEIEEAALALPGVQEAAAIPVMLAHGEDVGVLLSSADEGLNLAEMHRLLSVDLGPGRAPFRVLATAQRLPRTGQEKLDRQRVRALWQSLEGATRPMTSMQQPDRGTH